MKKGSKRFTFIVGTSICLLCGALFGVIHKGIISSRADINQEQSQKTTETVRRTRLSVDDNDKLVIERKKLTDISMGKENSTTMFIYVCGSDLETNYGAATNDINEMLAANESENVNIVIQTGGAKSWQGNDVKKKQIGRYVVKGHKLVLVDSQPQANMGEAETLQSFIEWGVKNYPAEHMSLELWNHGSGSVKGVCYDEKNKFDSLSLGEVESALANASKNMTDKFEYIGFDACLMATIEVANMLAPYANYMIASEEVEAGCGWEYTSIINKLVENPDIDPVELGKTIIDSFYAGTEDIDQSAGATLSIVDLDKVDSIMVAFNDVSKEMNKLADDKDKVLKFTAAANKSENYGGNNRFEGYTNMVDLGDFMKNIASDVEGADRVLDAISKAVLYQRLGKTVTESTGLAFYYPIKTPTLVELNYNRNIAVSPYYMEYLEKVLYVTKHGGIDGFVSNNWAKSEYYYELDFGFIEYEFATSKIYKKLKNKEYYKNVSFDDNWYNWENKKASNKKTSGEDLSDEKMIVIVEDDENVTVLGSIADENAEFDGKWFTLEDGQMLAAELINENNGVALYTAPAIVNKKTTNIRFMVSGEQVTVLGTWDGINEVGMADKGVKQIKTGSTIVPLYMTINTVTNEVTMEEGNSAVVTNDIVAIDDIYAGFGCVAQLEDIDGNFTISNIG